jgi:hypothetical protein
MKSLLKRFKYNRGGRGNNFAGVKCYTNWRILAHISHAPFFAVKNIENERSNILFGK